MLDLRGLEEAVAALALQLADAIGDLLQREAGREQQLVVGDRLHGRAAQRGQRRGVALALVEVVAAGLERRDALLLGDRSGTPPPT